MNPVSPRRVRILVMHHDPQIAGQLAEDLRALLDPLGDDVDVVVAGEIDGMLRAGHEALDAGAIVPIAFIGSDPTGGGSSSASSEDPGVTALMAIDDDVLLRTTRTVLVTDRPSLRGVEAALQRGAVHAMLTRPWTLQGLGELLEAHLATFVLQHAPERIDDVAPLIDDDDRRDALHRIEYEGHAVADAPDAPHLLLDASVSDEEIEDRMVELLDRALGHPPRIRVAPGTVLIEAGEDVGGIYVILDGIVRLTSRSSTGDKVLHERSTGAIIGLLSLAEHRRAMQRCRAVTDVRAIPVTLDQLARALDANPELARLLNRVLISSLAKRLRRSDELQIELDQSLAELSAARVRLVASERLAALGGMAAGMAHELNNPAAALVRAIDHAVDDLDAVLAEPEVSTLVRDTLTRSASMSTAELRRRRRVLGDAVGDRRLAERLIGLGVVDVDEAHRFAAMSAPELARLDAAARLGRALRNAANAAERIQELVAGLRSYARGENERSEPAPDVDVAAGLEAALRLVAHRLDDIQVRRRFDDVPTITASPGALQQVWVNLLTNAIDALAGHGTIDLTVTAADPDTVVVTVADDGPGIPPNVQERVFEPRFSTKEGRVHYGLGLGLSISRTIVHDHGGRIEVDSGPGHTAFTVELPTGAGTQAKNQEEEIDG